MSVSIPKDSAGEIEALQKTLGMKGRSELVRTAIRSLANETEGLERLKGTVNALLVVTHAHNEGIGKIFHQNEKLITTHMHQHVGEKCIEIFLLKGEAAKIREFYNALLRDKHVLRAKIVVI